MKYAIKKDQLPDLADRYYDDGEVTLVTIYHAHTDKIEHCFISLNTDEYLLNKEIDCWEDQQYEYGYSDFSKRNEWRFNGPYYVDYDTQTVEYVNWPEVLNKLDLVALYDLLTHYVKGK